MLDQLGAGLADEIRVAAQVAAHVHRRAELGEAVGLERLDDLGVEVQFFGGGGDRQAGALAAGTQPLADRTRRVRERVRVRPSRPSSQVRA